MPPLIDTRHRLFGDVLSKVTEICRNFDSVIHLKEKSLFEQCHNLLEKKGEATGLAQVQQLMDRYFELSDEEKVQFFLDILENFGPDKKILDEAIKKWKEDSSISKTRELHFASEPKSQDLLRRINQAPQGTKGLVQMRADLIGFCQEHPELNELDKDFSHLFASWFNRGFLNLQLIDWDASANLLEKVIAYEAVHEIRSWNDLRQRIAYPDRRLYSYFHPALSDEPLIFVEVALTNNIPEAIAPVLQQERKTLNPNSATTAVFYSISNCQKGLKGISFGNFLIKQVVESLKEEFPKLDTFVTLSPVPYFRRWALKQKDNKETILNKVEIELIDILENTEVEELSDLIDENRKSFSKVLAKFLVVSRSPRGGATDPVSRFHLGNGARLENLHLLADLSESGIKNSWGCMVNYLYETKFIEKNHEAYLNNDEIKTSGKVSNLVK